MEEGNAPDPNVNDDKNKLKKIKKKKMNKKKAILNEKEILEIYFGDAGVEVINNSTAKHQEAPSEITTNKDENDLSGLAANDNRNEQERAALVRIGPPIEINSVALPSSSTYVNFERNKNFKMPKKIKCNPNIGSYGKTSEEHFYILGYLKNPEFIRFCTPSARLSNSILTTSESDDDERVNDTINETEHLNESNELEQVLLDFISDKSRNRFFKQSFSNKMKAYEDFSQKVKNLIKELPPSKPKRYEQKLIQRFIRTCKYRQMNIAPHTNNQTSEDIQHIEINDITIDEITNVNSPNEVIILSETELKDENQKNECAENTNDKTLNSLTAPGCSLNLNQYFVLENLTQNSRRLKRNIGKMYDYNSDNVVKSKESSTDKALDLPSTDTLKDLWDNSMDGAKLLFFNQALQYQSSSSVIVKKAIDLNKKMSDSKDNDDCEKADKSTSKEKLNNNSAINVTHHKYFKNFYNLASDYKIETEEQPEEASEPSDFLLHFKYNLSSCPVEKNSLEDIKPDLEIKCDPCEEQIVNTESCTSAQEKWKKVLNDCQLSTGQLILHCDNLDNNEAPDFKPISSHDINKITNVETEIDNETSCRVSNSSSLNIEPIMFSEELTQMENDNNNEMKDVSSYNEDGRNDNDDCTTEPANKKKNTEFSNDSSETCYRRSSNQYNELINFFFNSKSPPSSHTASLNCNCNNNLRAPRIISNLVHRFDKSDASNTNLNSSNIVCNVRKSHSVRNNIDNNVYINNYKNHIKECNERNNYSYSSRTNKQGNLNGPSINIIINNKFNNKQNASHMSNNKINREINGNAKKHIKMNPVIKKQDQLTISTLQNVPPSVNRRNIDKQVMLELLSSSVFNSQLGQLNLEECFKIYSEKIHDNFFSLEDFFNHIYKANETKAMNHFPKEMIINSLNIKQDNLPDGPKENWDSQSIKHTHLI